MADLTTAVEIAAKGWHEENQKDLSDRFPLVHTPITWEDSTATWKQHIRKSVEPAVTALHKAGLLKDK